jgi:osmotically-inducible protein OsmY
MPGFALAGALGALLAYFFDPDSGRRRRKMAIQRAGGLVRRTARGAARTRRGVAAQTSGMAARAQHLKEEEKPEPDDVTLARKVETEIFRDADVPKGQINVNAEGGVVYLRGEVEQPDMIEELESKARDVQGVREVENLLHLPGQEAPTKPE